MSERELLDWILDGTPVPPLHAVKMATIESYLQKFGLKRFIETGTYYGSTTEYIGGLGIDTTTIELSPRFHAEAVAKFAHLPNIKCLLGNSADLLEAELAARPEPAVLWLDAHYSGGPTAKADDKETPVVEEMLAIFKHRAVPHVILIDDARCFLGGYADFPEMSDFQAFCKVLFPTYEYSVLHDIIRIHPPLA